MKLTPERLFGRKPLPGTASPTQLKMSADGRYGSFLLAAEDDRERLELWLVDIASAKARRLHAGITPRDGEETREERDGRERRRQFSTGITAYEWHPRKNEILFPANGGAWLLPIVETHGAGALTGPAEAGEAQLVTPPGTRQSGIRYSAWGGYVSYVRDGDLYCQNLAGAVYAEAHEERRLTRDGGGSVSNGLADFIAQEEMRRFEGHWWSPGDRCIAFTRVDEAPIPETHRHEMHADGIRVVPQRYPFAGGPNAEVRLGLLEVASGKVEWLDWAVAADDYLARVQFAPDGSLYVQAQSRNQQRLTLRRFISGRWENLLEERSETWVNLHDNLTFLDEDLKDRRPFLWTSQRNDVSQLLLQRRDEEARELTDAPLDVKRVLRADSRCAWVTGHCAWVTGHPVSVELSRRQDPRTQNIYRVEYAEGATWSSHENWTVSRFAFVEDAAVHRSSSVGMVLRSHGLTRPSELCVCDDMFEDDVLPGHLRPVQLDSHQLGVADVRNCSLVVVAAPSDPYRIPSLSLYGRLTEPSPRLPNRRYPVIVHVYGGPGVQRVRYELPPLTLQLFAQAGFGVFELDNRGSGNRHKAFEDVIHGRLGHVEVEDQLAGVEYLRRLEWVAADRIGIFGHSYGGYMVLMCLAASHVFRAGAAVAPVSDWTLYDTHYTERYLGTPQDNPQGYEASSPLGRAADIDAPLLLMHGMADDNVLFTHTLKFVKALQDAGKPFELMTYPGTKHSMQERNVAIHRYHCILDFFRRRLAPTNGG